LAPPRPPPPPPPPAPPPPPPAPPPPQLTILEDLRAQVLALNLYAADQVRYTSFVDQVKYEFDEARLRAILDDQDKKN
jgi:hypothetical protein